MSQRHLVLGAGPVGRATAALLAQQGEEVVLASRSGAGAVTWATGVDGIRIADTTASQAPAWSARRARHRQSARCAALLYRTGLLGAGRLASRCRSRCSGTGLDRVFTRTLWPCGPDTDRFTPLRGTLPSWCGSATDARDVHALSTSRHNAASGPAEVRGGSGGRRVRGSRRRRSRTSPSCRPPDVPAPRRNRADARQCSPGLR